MITPSSRVDQGFVAFVTPLAAPHFLAAGQSLQSDQASVRLRVSIPSAALARRVQVCLVPPECLVDDPALAHLGAVRAIAVGKLPVSFFRGHVPRARALLGAVERIAQSRPVLVDFSDDLGAAAEIYDAPFLREVQQRFLDACVATVPTSALRESLLPQARHGVTVIEDPYESPAASPLRFAPAETLRLAWFGVFGSPLRPLIEREFASIARALAPAPVELAFVTYEHEAPLVAEMASALQKVHPRFRLRHVPWSLAASAAAVEWADLVVIPQDAQSAWGRAKSHNRMVEAIRGGRFVVASPVPAYVELADFTWVGEDLAAGVRWALENPREVMARIAAGQSYVEQRFSPERIGGLWARALGL